MILVAGGTGELGLAVVRELCAAGRSATVLARPTSDVTAVRACGADVVGGDLREPDSLAGCCDGVDVVVATANAILPRRGERVPRNVLGPGYVALAREARRAGVRRLITISVPTQLVGRGAIDFDDRAATELALRDQGPPLTVVRPSLFMQSWLPAVGSRLAVRGEPNVAIDRGYWLARMVGATTQRSLDRFGIGIIPGRRDVRHSFIHVADLATFLSQSACADDLPDDVEIGGPEALTWPEVVDAHARAQERKVRRVRQPAAPFWALSRLARPVSPTAAHLLAAQHLVGTVSTVCPPANIGRPLRSVDDHLSAKAALGAPVD